METNVESLSLKIYKQQLYMRASCPYQPTDQERGFYDGYDRALEWVLQLINKKEKSKVGFAVDANTKSKSFEKEISELNKMKLIEIINSDKFQDLKKAVEHIDSERNEYAKSKRSQENS